MAALALPLAACETLPGPEPVAQGTVIDEKLMLGFVTSYEAATTAGRLARQVGLINDLNWPRFQALDRQAYAAVLAAEAAYRAGNANNALEALRQGQTAVCSMMALAGREIARCSQ